MNSALSCRDLVVAFGHRRILNGVSLDVAVGEWVSIVGPNGAGKTTLLRVVIGTQRRRAGTVEIDGLPVDAIKRRELARQVTLVPQTPLVPPGMTVSDYVLLGRTAHIPRFGTEGPRDVQAAEKALALLELTRFAHRDLGTLSGGERQRAFLARALAQEAHLILLDEPTTALDVGHQQEVLEVIDDLRRSRGLTIVSTMHDLVLAGQYASRTVLLHDGTVVGDGPPAEILTADTIARYYGASVQVIHAPTGTPVVVPLRAARNGPRSGDRSD